MRYIIHSMWMWRDWRICPYFIIYALLKCSFLTLCKTRCATSESVHSLSDQHLGICVSFSHRHTQIAFDRWNSTSLLSESPSPSLWPQQVYLPSSQWSEQQRSIVLPCANVFLVGGIHNDFPGFRLRNTFVYRACHYSVTAPSGGRMIVVETRWNPTRFM